MPSIFGLNANFQIVGNSDIRKQKGEAITTSPFLIMFWYPI